SFRAVMAPRRIQPALENRHDRETDSCKPPRARWLAAGVCAAVAPSLDERPCAELADAGARSSASRAGLGVVVAGGAHHLLGCVVAIGRASVAASGEGCARC